MNPFPAEIHEDVLEDSICKALSLTGVNVVPENLQACHRIKRSKRVIVKFKCGKQKQSLMYKRKDLGTKSQELTNLKFLGRLGSLLINVDSSRVPERYNLPGSSTML